MRDEAVILLVEDREEDVLFIRKAFEKAHVPNPLVVVRDGEDAIRYLAGERQYSNREEYPLPKLILLDLKMPRVDGFEVLKWIRSRPELSGVVVVVLTSSEQIRDVNAAYRLGANSFMVKPTDFQNIIELSKLIRDYWLHANVSPDPSRPPKKPKHGV